MPLRRMRPESRFATPWLALALFSFMLQSRALAFDKVSFSLTNIGSSPVSDVQFRSMPMGTVVPSIIGTDAKGQPIEASPLTALPSSEGVDASKAYVLLGTEDLPGGGRQDTMFLLFGYEPNPAYDPSDPASSPFLPVTDPAGSRVGQLSPSGRFEFELNLTRPGDIGLIIPSSADLSIGPLPYARGGSDSSAPSVSSGDQMGVTAIPEPAALVMWAAVAVGAGWRLRCRYRNPLALSESG